MKHRHHSYRWGIVAEYLCILWLVCKFYSILALRYRNPHGEIDIIALKGDVVVFIEVKARAKHEDAITSVTPAKQQRLLQSAHAFIASKKIYAHHGLRFDVMVVTSPLKIYHLKDAWRA